MFAFDADVLIYAAGAHPLGGAVRAIFDDAATAGRSAGIGSVLLIPETLIKPMRTASSAELSYLHDLLGRLDLIPTDGAVARLGTALGARHGLRAVDAIHLATAVAGGADHFLTNNQADFPTTITEIDVVYPATLDG